MDADEVVALPAMDGPAIAGLPKDDGGFIPIDQHARVRGVEDVYAAGDGTNFPIKQGGLGTQQADAAAAHIAHRLGAAITVQPFHPVLRGKLLTGEESLTSAPMWRAAEARRGRPGFLWWPPHKIAAGTWRPSCTTAMCTRSPSRRRSVDVEVALPREWHEQPMALDPYGSPPID